MSAAADWMTFSIQQIAKAYDVPPEILGLPPAPPMTPAAQAALDIAIYGAAYVSADPDGNITVHDPKKVTMTSDHVSGHAVDFNVGSWGYTGKPVPEEANLDGDGDPFSEGPKPYLLTFQAKTPASQHKTVWETPLGTLTKIGKIAHLQLRGTVSTGGNHQYELGADLATEDIELAKKLIGVIPNDGPGTGVRLLEESAGGQKFTWEAGTGWVPKGLTFHDWPDAKNWPEDGAQHTGPDGAVWEFRLAGGWIIVQPAAEYPSTEHRAVYGWYCTACCEHWSVHKGDPVGCESGGWLRPATSAEHKQALLPH
jgi:hypothetical protein